MSPYSISMDQMAEFKSSMSEPFSTPKGYVESLNIPNVSDDQMVKAPFRTILDSQFPRLVFTKIVLNRNLDINKQFRKLFILFE